MKLDNKNYWIIIFSIICLCGCVPPTALKKEDIKETANEVREELLEIQGLDPMESTDLSLLDSNSLATQRDIVEIGGNQKGVKVDDPSWQNYPIWVNLNVVPLRTFFSLFEEMTGLNFVVGEEVTGDITLKLNNVNWIEAFKLVLREKNLMHDVNDSGTVVIVHTHDFISEQSASYEKALSAILDANITTLITAIILFVMGSGPVRGFSITLGFGIITSVFTAIYLTRLFIIIWFERKRPKSIEV